MQLGDLDSFIAQAKAQAGAFADRTEFYVSTQISNFRDKRGQLNFAVSKLRAHPPRTDAPQALKDEYARVYALANDAKQKADWLGKIADQFTAVTGLGVLPVVLGLSGGALLAAIAIIGATIYTVTTAVSNYVARNQIVDAAIRSGRDPVAALQNYTATAGGGLFGDAAKLVWPVAIAGAVYLMIADKRGR